MSKGERAGARDAQNSTNQTVPKLPTLQGAGVTLDATNQRVRIADYKPHPRNYNRHPASQIERIGASLRKFGQPRSIVVWRSFIIAGHGVVEAARAMGWQEIRADVLPEDYPEHLALAYVAADNELGRLGDPDQAALAAILEESRAQDGELLEAMGYSDKEFQTLLNQVVRDGQSDIDRTNEDDADALVSKWGTEAGQIWQCGENRIMCGDSTNPAHVARLFSGRRATLLVADPPYNVGIDYLASEVDDARGAGEYEKFTRDWFGIWSDRADRQVITPGFNNLALWIRLYEKRIKMIAPWVKKNGMTRGYISLFACWEPVMFFGAADENWEPVLFVDGEKKLGKWERVRSNDIFEYPTANKTSGGDPVGVHPCPKPPKMIGDIINSYSNVGDLVCDAFSGSGTTIICAHQTQRMAAVMEMEPRWVASALERWLLTTGQTPTLQEAT